MSAVSTDAVMQQIESLVRRGAFKPIGRYLKEEDRDDRLAEAVGLTIEMALRTAAKGKLLPDAILVHHARQRAVDMSRHLVQSQGRGLDALNNANFIAGKTEVLHFEVADEEEGDVGDGDNQLLAAAVRRGTAPEELLSSAIDLSTWLDALHERDHQLLCLRAAGFSLKEISAELRTSISMVFARCKRLGLELAEFLGIDPPVRRRQGHRCAEGGACPA